MRVDDVASNVCQALPQWPHGKGAQLGCRAAQVPRPAGIWLHRVGPDRICLPRHVIPCNSINEGQHCGVAEDDVAGIICHALPPRSMGRSALT